MLRYFLITVLVLGCSASSLAADLTVTYQLKEGKKNKGERIEYWSDQFHLSSDKASKIDTLTDYSKGAMYTIDHGKKQIEVFNFHDMSGMMAEMNPMMTEMMNRKGPKGNKTMGESMQESTAKYFGDPEKAVLQKLGTLTIAGRSCDDYKVERKGKYGEWSEEVCVDSTLKAPTHANEDAMQMVASSQAMMNGSMHGLISPGQKELADLPGLPLRRVMLSKTKGMIFGGGSYSTDEEAISVQEGAIDPSAFQLPSDYKSIDQMAEIREQMQEMQKMMGGMGK